MQGSEYLQKPVAFGALQRKIAVLLAAPVEGAGGSTGKEPKA